MATYYVNPADIISDFLRVYLTDPRARAEATETQTFSPGSGDTEIDLAALSTVKGTVSCVTSVTIDGASTNAKKWRDYYWDYQNTKLTFFTAFAGTETVIVTYKYGAQNWIYSDKPDQELNETNFPRISVFCVTGSGKRLGQYEAPLESSPIMQIDTWAKDNYKKEISDRTYSGNYLARYLADQITKAFEENEEALFPVLYNYIPVGIPRVAPYSEEFQAHHYMIEANFKGLRLGRIDK